LSDASPHGNALAGWHGAQRAGVGQPLTIAEAQVTSFSVSYWRKQTLRNDFSEAEICPLRTPVASKWEAMVGQQRTLSKTILRFKLLIAAIPEYA
jgi:hypothetical protein